MNHSLTADQIEISHAVRDHGRVAIKGGHGVGKTDCLGDLPTWFLHCFDPAIIVTTAPSAEQVRNEVWRYIRLRVASATTDLLPGLKPVEPMWDVAPTRYAQGLSTDKGDRFRGKHAENMLFIFEEASGVPHWAWEEAENMCTASNNKIVVVANPVEPSGDFYDCFKGSSGWHCITMSCLNHPNVISGREIFPGAVTRRWVEQRVKKYAIPIEFEEKQTKDFEWPEKSGKWHRPTATFMARVLGEFPDEGPDTLIPLSWIVRARENKKSIDETTPIDIGMDIAYSGGDWCVMFARRGPSVIARKKWQGTDTEGAKTRAAEWIKSWTDKGHVVGTVAVDGTSWGAGVADGLKTYQQQGIIKCQRVLGVLVAERANNPEIYANKRAELCHALATRFRLSDIDLSRLGEDADDFEAQAVQINKKRETRSLRELIEGKDQIRDRTKKSPDDFDAMVLTFIDTTDAYAEMYAQLISAG